MSLKIESENSIVPKNHLNVLMVDTTIGMFFG